MLNKATSIPSAKFEPSPVHKMMTNNIKTFHNEKMKDSKLIETDINLDL